MNTQPPAPMKLCKHFSPVRDSLYCQDCGKTKAEHHDIESLLAQRNELREALKALLDACHKQGHGWVPTPDGIHARITVHQDKFSAADTQARTALAKVQEAGL